MSLILDALKRAERERKMGQAPTALEEVALPPPVARQTPGRRPIILAIVALLIVALAVFAFIRSRRPAAPEPAPAETGFVEVIHDPEPAAPTTEAAVAANPADDSQDARIEDGAGIASLDDLTGDPAAGDDQPDTSMAADETYAAQPAVEAGSTLVTPSQSRAPAPVVALQPAPAPSSTTLKLDPKPSPASPAPQPQQLATNANATITNATPAAGEPLVIPIEEYVPGNTAATTAPAPAAHAAVPPPPSSPAPQAQSAAIRSLKDMPPAYRATFPALAVDVHVYNDNPQRRFVLINGRRYREGEALGEGPRLVQIVPEGVVFDWHNEQVLYGSR